MKIPFSSSSPGYSLYILGSNVTTELLLPISGPDIRGAYVDWTAELLDASDEIEGLQPMEVI